MKKLTVLFFAAAMILSTAFISESLPSDSSFSVQAQTTRKKSRPGIIRSTARGTKYVGKKTWKGTKYVGRKSYKGAKWVGGKTWDGTKWVGKTTWKGVRKVGGTTKKVVY